MGTESFFIKPHFIFKFNFTKKKNSGPSEHSPWRERQTRWVANLAKIDAAHAAAAGTDPIAQAHLAAAFQADNSIRWVPAANAAANTMARAIPARNKQTAPPTPDELVWLLNHSVEIQEAASGGDKTQPPGTAVKIATMCSSLNGAVGTYDPSTLANFANVGTLVDAADKWR